MSDRSRCVIEKLGQFLPSGAVDEFAQTAGSAGSAQTAGASRTGVATAIVTTQFGHWCAAMTGSRTLRVAVLGGVTRLALGVERRRVAVERAGVCAKAAVLVAVCGTVLASNFSIHSLSVS